LGRSSERVVSRVVTLRKLPDIPAWVPITLAAIISAFCIYKLAMAGALSASEAWDGSVC